MDLHLVIHRHREEERCNRIRVRGQKSACSLMYGCRHVKKTGDCEADEHFLRATKNSAVGNAMRKNSNVHTWRRAPREANLKQWYSGRI